MRISLVRPGTPTAAMDYGSAAQAARHASWVDFEMLMRCDGRLVLLFTTRAAEPFHRFAYRPDDVLLFGSESASVPDEVHAAAHARLIIPIRSETRSLNVIAAAALALGEALRQTGGFRPVETRDCTPEIAPRR